MSRHDERMIGTELLGREQELRTVLRWLDDPGCRLITIAGPGGVGKTSLARSAAAQAAPAHGDTAVSLAALASADAVPLAIAEALGLALRGPRPAAAQLLDHLAGRAPLLLLDGCEHLLDTGLAGALQGLLDGAPGVRLLATSREPLGLRDEQVLALGGLAAPSTPAARQVDRSPAARLFAQRARRLQPDFVLGAANRAAVVRICRRVDGLPLAIELAAGWVRALAPAELAAALDGPPAGAEPADPERQGGIHAAIRSSWALLSPDERRALARLSVFSGGCDRAAAAAVAAASPALLNTLIDRSLVRREQQRGMARYTLHELVHASAAERLAADPAERADAVARHGAYYADLLQRLSAPSPGITAADIRRALNREIANLQAAWVRAAAAGDTGTLAAMVAGMQVLYETNGWIDEGAALLGRAAEALAERPAADSMRGYLLALQSAFARRAGRADEAQRLADAGLALIQAGAPIPGLADLSYSLGMAELQRGAPEAAGVLLARAPAVEDDPFIGLWGLIHLGLVARRAGDDAAAERAYRRCLAAARRTGNASGESAALSYLADLERIRGDHGSAAAHLDDALSAAGTQGDPWALAVALTVRGSLALDQGAAAEAHELLSEAVSAAAALSHEPWVLGEALCGLARADVALGALRDGLRRYGEVVALLPAAGILAGTLVKGMAELFARAGDEQTALALLLALERTPAERAALLDAAAARAAIAGRLPAARRGAATRAAAGPLLPWLARLCARPLPPEPPAP